MLGPPQGSATPNAEMDSTAADLRHKSRIIGAGQWSVALIVMAGSAISAELAYQHLGEHVGVGAITGLGVDLALAGGLVLDGWMRREGLTTTWGTVLRWLTAAMTLCLNSGVSYLTGHYTLALMHTFLPVVLVVLTEAGQESQLKLHHLAQQRTAAEAAGRALRLAEEKARYDSELRDRKEERQQADERAERIRKDNLQLEETRLADRQEERAQRDTHLAANLAAVLSLGAALRARPTRRPTRRPTAASQDRPRRSQSAAPAARPKSVPVTDDLLSRARKLRTERESQGLTAGRTVLQNELGVPERTAKELVRRLDEHPLHAVAGVGRA